jgi:hypothetical protein
MQRVVKHRYAVPLSCGHVIYTPKAMTRYSEIGCVPDQQGVRIYSSSRLAQDVLPYGKRLSTRGVTKRDSLTGRFVSTSAEADSEFRKPDITSKVSEERETQAHTNCSPPP